MASTICFEPVRICAMVPALELMGPRWQAMCQAAGWTMFAWAHTGIEQNGVIELRDDGVLVTQWCIGTWKTLPDNQDHIKMVFGSSSLICHFEDGGFIVDQKYRIKNRINNYWPGQPKSRGWIIPKPVHPRLWYTDAT